MIILLLVACGDITFSLHGKSYLGDDTGWDSGGWDSGGWDSGGWGGGDDTGWDSGWDSGGWGGGGDSDPGAEIGTAEGTYGTSFDIPFSLASTNFIRTGDVNGDGLQDIIVTGSDMGGWTYGDRDITLGQAIQQADGSFEVTEIALEQTSGVRAPFAVGDLDGDGADDIVLGHFNGLSVWSGGPGGLSETEVIDDAWTSAVGLGDADGDGDLDLATMNVDLEAVVYTNDGSGGLSEHDRFGLNWDYSGDFDYSDIQIIDVDEDGNADLAAVLPWNYDPRPNLSVHLGDGAGDFDHSGVETYESTGSGPYRIVMGDFNGDGTREFMLGTMWRVLETLDWEGGGFGDVHRYANELAGPSWFVTDDVDGDGDADLLASDGFSVEMIEQGEDGLLSAGDIPVSTTVAGTVACELLAMGDMDGDGCQDIVVAHYPDGVTVVPYLCDPDEAEDEDEDEDEDEEIDGEDDEGEDEDDTGTPVRPKSASRGCSTSPGGGGLGLSLVGLAAIFLRRRSRV